MALKIKFSKPKTTFNLESKSGHKSDNFTIEVPDFSNDINYAQYDQSRLECQISISYNIKFYEEFFLHVKLYLENIQG